MSEWDCKHGNSHDLCPTCFRDRIRELEEGRPLCRCADEVRCDMRKRIRELEEALRAVDEWDIRWAEGLDSNVESIKELVRKALEGE